MLFAGNLVRLSGGNESCIMPLTPPALSSPTLFTSDHVIKGPTLMRQFRASHWSLRLNAHL